MSGQSVRDVLARFKTKDRGEDLISRRVHYDRIADGQRLPKAAHFEPIELGGLPAERVIIQGTASVGIILFFHGGGYVVGSPRGYRALTATLAQSAAATVIAVDYRLAPEHPFPAAVEDTTAAYRALLDEGIPANQISFAGDSAGGGLVIATMLSARESGLPMPAAGYGLSPWLDLAGDGQSFTEMANVDPLMTSQGALGCAAAYLQGSDTRHPWASPVHADLTGLAPLLLQVGSTELFLDDSTRLTRAAALAGVHVELQVWPKMLHVWQRFPGFLTEAASALSSGAKFLRERMHPVAT